MKKELCFVATSAGHGIKVDIKKSKEPLIKLAKDDKIVSDFTYDPNEFYELLYITSGGFANRFKLSDIRVMPSGGPGVRIARLSAQTGTVVQIEGLHKDEEKEIKIFTSKMKDLKKEAITIEVSEIPITMRGSQGIRVIRQSAKEKVIGFELN